MFSVLLTSYLAVHIAGALPTQVLSTDIQPSTCTDITHCRSLSNIIWSCLATVLACAWAALHPNVPGVDEGFFTVTLRLAKMTVMVVTAPELLIFWAILQWITARVLAAKYAEYGWTRTHGFFALMGGFMVYGEDERPRLLLSKDLDKYLSEGDIGISVEEILDRSKGDMLSKGIVLLQTGWFILQLLARVAQRLPITGLELVTLAFAILNFITYGLWWNKPLCVQCPIILGKKTPILQKGQLSSQGQQPKPQLKVLTRLQRVIRQAAKYAWIFIWDAADFLLADIDEAGSEKFYGDEKRVPTYYWGADLIRGSTDIGLVVWQSLGIAILIATVFGAVHCAGWSFYFPSEAEKKLWHISSVVIAGLPLAVFTSVVLITSLAILWRRVSGPDICEYSNLWEAYKGVWRLIWPSRLRLLLKIVAFTPYIIARYMLLAQAVASLRALPPGAYTAVEWTTFIPHI